MKPDTPSKLAVMVVVPVTSVVASPLEPFVLLIVATAVLEELQVTEVVISCVVLSEYVPVAGAIVNSCVWDLGGDPFFFNTINEFHSLNNICQALRTM